MIPSLEAERESFRVRKRALLDAFADGSLSPIATDLGKINAETREARDAIYENNFRDHRPDRDTAKYRLVDVNLAKFFIRITSV